MIKSNYADVWLEVGTMSRRTVGTRCIQLKRALSRVLVYYYVALVKFLSFLLGAQKFLAIFHLLLKDKNGSWWAVEESNFGLTWPNKSVSTLLFQTSLTLIIYWSIAYSLCAFRARRAHSDNSRRFAICKIIMIPRIFSAVTMLYVTFQVFVRKRNPSWKRVSYSRENSSRAEETIRESIRNFRFAEEEKIRCWGYLPHTYDDS